MVVNVDVEVVEVTVIVVDVVKQARFIAVLYTPTPASKSAVDTKVRYLLKG